MWCRRCDACGVVGMAWAVYFLASHPPVQDRLYEEIVRVLGKTGQVTAENMSDLMYAVF